MHCTVAYLDEYSLPDSFESLKVFMLTLVLLINYHIVFGLKTLHQSATF